MADLRASIERSLEASRVKEQLLQQQGPALAAVVDALRAAFDQGRTLHTLGVGRNAPLAGYLAALLHEGGGGRTLPARLLPTPGRSGADAVPAVSCFVAAGDALLIVASSATADWQRLIATARARKARVVGLLSPGARGLARSCDATIAIASPHSSVLAEVAVAVGHVLLEGLLATTKASSIDAAPPLDDSAPSLTGADAQAAEAARRSGTHARGPAVIDRDNPTAADAPAEDEGALLAAAVLAGTGPPTDPRGVVRRESTRNSIRFRCGACDEVMVVEAHHAGRRGRCARCSCEFVIPQPQGASQAAPRPQVASQAAPRPQAASQAAPRPQGDPGAGTSRSARRRRRGERRRAPRIEVQDGVVRLARDGFPDGRAYHEPHTLQDLSMTGLQLAGRLKDLRIGETCYVAIDVPAFAEPLLLRGEVRRVVRKGPQTYGTGVRFTDYVGDAQARIQRLIDAPQLRRVRRR